MMDYSLRELESFMAVAEELSFTRAAGRLQMAQPALSRHVRSLEDRLGARLFDRTNRAVALTAAGRQFYTDVRAPLLRLEEASAAVKRTARGEVSRLEVGFVSSLLGAELAGVFRRFRAAVPRVQLRLQDRIPAEQLRSTTLQHRNARSVDVRPGNVLGPPHHRPVVAVHAAAA